MLVLVFAVIGTGMGSSESLEMLQIRSIRSRDQKGPCYGKETNFCLDENRDCCAVDDEEMKCDAGLEAQFIVDDFCTITGGRGFQCCQPTCPEVPGTFVPESFRTPDIKCEYDTYDHCGDSNQNCCIEPDLNETEMSCTDDWRPELYTAGEPCAGDRFICCEPPTVVGLTTCRAWEVLNGDKKFMCCDSSDLDNSSRHVCCAKDPCYQGFTYVCGGLGTTQGDCESFHMGNKRICEWYDVTLQSKYGCMGSEWDDDFNDGALCCSPGGNATAKGMCWALHFQGKKCQDIPEAGVKCELVWPPLGAKDGR